MCPSFKAALDAGKPVKIDAHHALTLADGMRLFNEDMNLSMTYH